MKSFSEMLKGNQHKIDKNKNGKIDSHDFKLLKKMKKEEVSVEEGIIDVVKDVISKEKAYQAQKQKKAGEVLSKLKKEEVETGCGCSECSCSKEIGEQAPVAPSLMKHRISVTVSDPDHTMVSKRKEKVQKTVIVTHSDNKEGAQKVGEKFYKKKGFVVHDSHHAGMVKEEAEIDEATTGATKLVHTRTGKDGAKYHIMQDSPSDFSIHREHNGKTKHIDTYGSLHRAKSVLDNEVKEEVKQATGDLKDACWKGYTAVGMKMKNGKKVPNCVPVKEGIDNLVEKDDSEYDYEGEMAVTQLKTISRHAEALQAKMKPDTNLPEWVQSKITLATDYMQTAHDYLMSELDEKIDMSKADMGAVIRDFKKSDAPQFAGKSVEKRRQMAIAAKLQADNVKKEGVEMKSYKQFMEELVDKLPEESVDEALDMKLLKSMQKDAKPRPKTSSDAIDPKTGKLKPYGYRGKSEYEKSETGDDDEPQKRGRKTGVTVGSYKRRQSK